MMKRIVVLQDEQLLKEELAALTEPAPPSVHHKTAHGITLRELARRAALDAERLAIKEVLERVHWNRAEAARVLKIGYKALLYKIDQCGLGRKRAS
jgi:DNA-binding NtrC family response regulator